MRQHQSQHQPKHGLCAMQAPAQAVACSSQAASAHVACAANPWRITAARYQHRHLQHLAACFFTYTFLLAARLTEAAAATPSSEPGAVLFHQGDDALTWDHDALVTARSLQGPDITNVEAFLGSSSVGDYFGFRPIEALHMPVPVNLVFVGFAADGNMHVNISTDQLQEWFGHLDHVLPHARVELAELSCAEDGHCSGLVHGRMEPRPVPSYVHLNFSCNLVLTQRVAVARTFERAIHAFSRPVDPEIEMGAQQVDVSRMEDFINNFLQHLNLHDRGYTLVVMNPTWSVSEPVYGYRLGMSQSEMDLLLTNTDKVKQALNSAQHYPVIPAPPNTGGWWSKTSRQDVSKFGTQDLTWNCDAWLTAMDKFLTQVEDYRKAMLKTVGPVKGAAAIVQAVSLINWGRAPISTVLREELLFPDPYQSVYSKFRTMHPAEDCLVGNWVSNQRWFLLDLTAGNFDWGPALGGEGVVHKHSIPSVADHFSHLQTVKQKFIESKKSEDEKQLDQQIESKVHQAKSERANRAFQAYAYEIQLKRGQRGAPGSSRPETQDEVDEQARQWKIKYQEAVLKAELDVYTEYSAKYCDGVAKPMPVCQKMKEASLAARNLLAKLAGSQASSVDVWRDVSWKVFQTELNLEEADVEVADAAQRAKDLFLAELNNVLSRALRHVITPPTASWARAGGALHDTATPWPTHVTFQIYVIREAVHAHTEIVPDARPFDVDGFKYQVGRLALPTQHFSFVQHTVALQDDPVLATAVAAAQRTSAQEIPTDSSSVQETERVYLDTRVLAHVLRQRFANALKKDRHSLTPSSQLAAERQQRLASLEPGSSRTRHGDGSTDGGSATHKHHELPVFVFELHREYAVLLDEHYNAKALEDMVMVVQNAARDDEHPTGMMCGGALLARPLSALREALSATLLHLSGVLPPHLGYNPSRRRVVHDWLWSVGSNPHSATSVGTVYSDTQRDAAARSYLLDAVDSSVDAVNAGIRALRRINPTKAVLKHLKDSKEDVEQLLSLWPSLLEAWRRVMEAAWVLDWATASRELHSIEDTALSFMHTAQKLANVPMGGHCSGIIKPGSEALVLPTLVASVAVAAGALLWLLWPAVFQRGSRDNNRYRVKY